MFNDFIQAFQVLNEQYDISRLGVSIGGPMNPLEGTILSPPHLPGWDNIPLRAQLELELGIPVHIVHDAAACLLAEWRWGAAKGCSHCAYLTMGTGFGAGLMIHNQIVIGPDGQTPEIGHVRIAEDGPEVFGKCGCSESFCSGTGMAKYANQQYPETFPEETTTLDIFNRAQDGCFQAQEVLDHSARMIGRVCAMLADIFSPQVIVLGSLARYLGDQWRENIIKEFHCEALPLNAAHVKIVLPGLDDRLQDLSAIAAALTE